MAPDIAAIVEKDNRMVATQKKLTKELKNLAHFKTKFKILKDESIQVKFSVFFVLNIGKDEKHVTIIW